MPSGPGVISEDCITQIAATVPPSIATFLLTCESSPEAIIAQQRRCRTNTIQLCDHLPNTIYPELREALPQIKLVQVVHVTDQSSVEYAIAAASHVDALLLDSGNLNLAVKELGGTGRTHDWTLSRRIRDAVAVPIYLAGGLNPGTSLLPLLRLTRSASTCAAVSGRTTFSIPLSFAPFSLRSREHDYQRCSNHRRFRFSQS